LGACGGGGSSSDANKAIAPCRDRNGDKGLAQAKVIAEGKTLHETTSNTRIRLWHLADDRRKACIIHGSVEVR